MSFILLLGRILFSLIFILNSFSHFSKSTIEYAESMGVFLAPFTVPFSGILILASGLSILLGYKARIGAWILVLFLIPTTLIMHQFWNQGSEFAIMMQHLCFWKNLSMLGAALMITYFGSGPMSMKE